MVWFDHFCRQSSNKNSPLNRDNPLNRSPLNRDTTVISKFTHLVEGRGWSWGRMNKPLGTNAVVWVVEPWPLWASVSTSSPGWSCCGSAPRWFPYSSTIPVWQSSSLTGWCCFWFPAALYFALSVPRSWPSVWRSLFSNPLPSSSRPAKGKALVGCQVWSMTIFSVDFLQSRPGVKIVCFLHAIKVCFVFDNVLKPLHRARHTLQCP